MVYPIYGYDPKTIRSIFLDVDLIETLLDAGNKGAFNLPLMEILTGTPEGYKPL
jgi:hypothetical protein